MSVSRRELLLGAAALVGLSRKGGRPVAGRFVDDGGAAGHRLRERGALPKPARRERAGVVIVGGGIAGLSAAWQLQRRGVRDFVVLELEAAAGGNARGGANEVSAYPWAAHYVPVPDAGAVLVRELFEELGVLKDGRWDERALCFAPHERVFAHGEWHAGLGPEIALRRGERAQVQRFAELMDAQRATGQFTIPMARGARSSPLDAQSMAAWMDAQGLRAESLRWYVDYACRDDYGARAADVSAWAGIHYFAARPPGDDGPLTWPEGNAWVTRRLLERLAAHVVPNSPALRVDAPARGPLHVLTPRAKYSADAVIWAAPSFVAPHVIDPWRGPAPAMVYSPWLTANLTLERWPEERGAAPAWDNVIYGSPGLGYVVATHQSLRTVTERTVWTYYRALDDHDPRAGRQLLLQRSWKEWTEEILADLERAHPDIRACVSRVDIMRMGHAMVRPTVGFLDAPGRRWLADGARERVLFANSDVSGLSLFEEAQHRGVRAADRAMRLLSRGA